MRQFIITIDLDGEEVRHGGWYYIQNALEELGKKVAATGKLPVGDLCHFKTHGHFNPHGHIGWKGYVTIPKVIGSTRIEEK